MITQQAQSALGIQSKVNGSHQHAAPREQIVQPLVRPRRLRRDVRHTVSGLRPSHPSMA